MAVNRHVYVVLGLAVAWMFLKGVVNPVTFGEGLLLSALAVLATRAILKPEVGATVSSMVLRVPAYLRYLGFFVVNMTLSNLDVAYRALHPRLPVYPGIVAVDIEGLSDLEVTMMANTITLTPGTLTMDVDMRRKRLYVHAIDARDLDAVRAYIKDVERHVAEVLR